MLLIDLLKIAYKIFAGGIANDKAIHIGKALSLPLQINRGLDLR